MIYLITLLVGLIVTCLNTKNKVVQFLFTLFVVTVEVYLMGHVSELHSFDTSAYEYMVDCKIKPNT